MAKNELNKKLSLDKIQKFNQYTAKLPNLELIKENAFQEFKDIRHNLSKAIILNELRPGFMHWSTRLQTFINEYGICFKKTEHIMLIELYLEVIFIPDIDLGIVSIGLAVLVELLKKNYLLSRDDLKIDWRQVYKLHQRIRKVDDRSTEFAPQELEQVTLVNFVSYARAYFDLNATREMLEDWRPMMCPFDLSFAHAFELFDLFLPSLLREHEIQHGFKLWIDEFLNMWLSTSISRSYWEPTCLSLLSRVAADNIGLFDWTPYIPYIFSKLLRGFGLTLASEETLGIRDDEMPKQSAALLNELSKKFAATNTDIFHYAKLIVSMLGCGENRNVCMDYIVKVFNVLSSYYHPSNSDVSMENFYTLLESLPNELIDRIRHERSEKFKLVKNKETIEVNLIQDSDISSMVNCLKDIVLTAIFSKTHFNEAIKAFQYLCFLRSDIMLPPLLEKISTSFDVLIETHRYTSMLACLVSVPRELVSFNPMVRRQFQLDIVDLMCSVLPGIDVNDLNKFILTNQFLANVLSNVAVCNCVDAITVRTDLSEHEVELCLRTAKFEDFVHELLQKVFEFIDSQKNDGSDNLESINNMGLFSRNMSEATEENVIQSHLVQMTKVLVNQSSVKILKLIIRKLRSYMNEKTFDFRSGMVVSSLCGFLANSINSEEAFETFFSDVYTTLKQFKHSNQYQKFLKNERGDPIVAWNLQLLSSLLESNGLLLINYVPRIMELINWYKPSINMDCILHITSSYNHFIGSMTTIHPVKVFSFNDFYLTDNESDFFKKHLPIRHWGEYVSLKDLKVDYHIPTVQEMKIMTNIIDDALNESMRFLNKSLILNNPDNVTKEENYRELNFIYHILFGSSRILKRPPLKIVQEHIKTDVEIGVSENLNKGLGFEVASLNEIRHEFSTDELNTLMKLKNTVNLFILKIADKLIKESTSDTVMMILIARILTTSSIIYGSMADDFKKTWMSHFITKATIQNKLILKKYPRDELIRRVYLQYNYRTFHINTRLNEQDRTVIEFLTYVSINSLYEVVRTEVRANLYSLLSQYPYSSLLLVPKIIKYLEKNNNEKTRLTKDQLEGCLLLINGSSQQPSFLLKQDWTVMRELWPTLYKCKNFEKENSSQLLDSIYEKVNETYESFNNSVKLNSKVIINTLLFNPTLATEYGTDDGKADEYLRLKRYNANKEIDRANIASIMQSLISISSDRMIVLKNQRVSLFSLLYLLNPAEAYPELLTNECVNLFVDALVHENVNFRQIGVDALCIILKMMKHKKETKKLKIQEMISAETNNSVVSDKIVVNKPQPGYRPDNQWYMYDPLFLNDCFETSGPGADADLAKWNRTHFLDKNYWGYYCWPAEITVSLNNRRFFRKDESTMNKFKHVCKPIIKRFQSDPDFIWKFIRYATIEENRGHESFDKKKFHLFKGLFRNFGSVNIFNGFYENLYKLVGDRDPAMCECNQRLAAELIAGVVRGSKYWPLNDLKSLWKNLKPILDLAIKNITAETLFIWVQGFSTCFEDQDPRRMTFYLNYFQALFLKALSSLRNNTAESKASSFEHLNALQLMSALGEFEWRIPKFWSSLLVPLQENMGNTNKFLRELLPVCLSHVNKYNSDFCLTLNLTNDIESLLTGLLKENSILNKFSDHVLVRLNEAFDLFEILGDKSDSEKVKDLQRKHVNEFIANLNFLQTIVNWLYVHLNSCIQPCTKLIVKIIEKLCKMDKVASYEELIKVKLTALKIFLPILTLDESCIFSMLDILKQNSKSPIWKIRLSTLQIIQNFSIYNLFLLRAGNKSEIKKLTIDLISDEDIRVRNTACITLTSLIHSNFVQVEPKLISYFTELSNLKSKRNEEKDKLIKRHGGILGLCSIVNAFPYDIPNYLPEVLVHICQFTNEPAPISDSVKKYISEFKRTHQDNWHEDKLKFSREQLDTLSDTFMSQNYYA